MKAVQINKMNYTEFFNLIYESGGINKLWEKMLDMIKRLQPDLSEDVLKLLCIYFSLTDDGNACIALDEKILKEKWSVKWNGLLLEREDSFNLTALPVTSEDFFETIKNGILEINGGKASNLIEFIDKNYSVDEVESISKIFCIVEIEGIKWLYSTKYFAAKCSIEERVKILFKEENVSLEKIPALKEEYKKIAGFELNEEQLEAIIRGQKENLIITGGPGSGKTTAICYILWQLFKEAPEYLGYDIYLAAPSGKAAERVMESIHGALSNISETERKAHSEIFDKLNKTSSSTIHRLLSFNPSENGFSFNRKNQFDKNSIFVIDEASMIDISLFKSLLEAIPEGARLFILGDKDQLPSVQAGAVLGELLANKKNSVVSLIYSNRFNSKSKVGKLAFAINDDKLNLNECLNFKFWSQWISENSFDKEVVKGQNPVSYIQLEENKKAAQIKEIVHNWSDVFYNKIAAKVKENISTKKRSEITEADLNEIWKLSIDAKILCAERRGIRGVSELNHIISKRVISENEIEILSGEEFFDGELLMITKNQKMFRLYNGDIGVVVSFNDSDLKYLMIQKEVKTDDENSQTVTEGIFNKGSYFFYPLYLLPRDSMELSYAITIHKSQGSGYRHIMIFLPEKNGHPLLNRQILYTGVTRTEGNTYIVSSSEAMNNAKNTIITRDTNIIL